MPHDDRWMPIPGYENHYLVSVSGFVMRVGGKVLKSGTSSGGYQTVSLCQDGVQKSHRVHRLVLLGWVGPCQDGHEVNHINSHKSDNRLENLEYVTRSQNIRHSLANGARRANGSDVGTSKLTEAQVLFIRKVQGVTDQETAEAFGVSRTHVSSLRRGQNWAHLIPSPSASEGQQDD